MSLTLSVLMAAATAGPLPNQPVAELDLDRYAGQWHEIAHLPMFFQRKCVSDTTATYTRQPDGTIEVDNACRTAEGEVQRSIGAAKTVPGGKAGQLKVRFAPKWLSWIPGVWADYWVVDLDPDYRWAVVGSPSRKYLWILSRTPTMEKTTFDTLRTRAKQRGYDVSKLVAGQARALR